MRWFVALLFIAPGCVGEINSASPGSGTDAGSAQSGNGSDAGASPALELFDIQMLEKASHVSQFTKINTKPSASAIGAFNIDVLVNQDAAEFKQIHPETSGSKVVMPVGTLIVRNVLDAAGKVTKVTLMAKGAAGYDPTLGDWWFGVTDPSGAPLTDATGLQVGRLSACHS